MPERSRSQEIATPDRPDRYDQYIRVTSVATRLSPARIALIYTLVSVSWIYFSDKFLELLLKDPLSLTRLQTYKGVAFIFLSAGMLHGLIRRYVTASRASEQNLKALIASLPEAILVIDRNLHCVKANRQATTLLRLPAEELFHPISEVLQKAQVVENPLEETLESLATRTLQGESVRDVERLLKGPDGKSIFVRIHTAPVMSALSDSPERAVIMFEDISPIRRLDHLRDEFLSTAAHELKSPMSTIKAYVQFLRRSRADTLGERETQTFAVLERQCDRMDKLIRELVEFSRLQLGRLELCPERFDLSGLCSQIVAQMQKISPKHELRFETKEAVEVVADPSRIEQVLSNLVDNAIKFSPDGGPVCITLEKDARGVVVSVTDEGLGVPADKRDQIFKRYFRAHTEGANRGIAGMGMGLFICKELVRRHGGRIWHENGEPRGSIFRFTLPADPAEIAGA